MIIILVRFYSVTLYKYFLLSGFVLLLTIFPSSTSSSNQTDFHVSPFSGIRWKNSPVPQVRIKDQWYQLLEVDGIPADTLNELAIQGAGLNWKRAYVEWFDWLLMRAGKEFTPTTDLTLIPVGTNDPVTIQEVPLTAENTLESLEYFYITSRVVKRESVSEMPGGPDYLTRRIDGIKAVRSDSYNKTDTEILYSCINGGIDNKGCMFQEWLSPESAVTDLANLEWLIENKYSYPMLSNPGYKAGIDAIRKGLGDGVSRRDFALQVNRLLALLGDGHSHVSFTESSIKLPRGFVPVDFRQVEGRIAVFQPGSRGFFDEKLPFLKSIDGKPVESWFSKAGETVPDRSKRLYDFRTTQILHNIAYIRSLMGKKPNDTAKITLTNKSYSKDKTYIIPLDRYASYYGLPDMEREILEDNVGYLAIRTMRGDKGFLEDLKRYMEEFEDTDGLIIDIRGNGGGTRDVLHTLFPYLMSDKDLLRIVNVSAIRANTSTVPRYREGFLKRGYSYPIDSEYWTPEERKKLKRFSSSFRPVHDLPDSDYTSFHYLAVRRDHESVYYYDKPVVILMNQTNFSAAEVFLSAFKDWDNVTLLGTPTQGGSGNPARYYLPNSRIVLKLSSMVTFRRNGKLYETGGIEPDIYYEMDLEDWKRYFEGDTPMVNRAKSIIFQNKNRFSEQSGMGKQE